MHRTNASLHSEEIIWVVLPDLSWIIRVERWNMPLHEKKGEQVWEGATLPISFVHYYTQNSSTFI